MGLPILVFPSETDSSSRGSGLAGIQEGDLHILFKYYLAVVPRYVKRIQAMLDEDTQDLNQLILACYFISLMTTMKKIVDLAWGYLIIPTYDNPE